MGLDGLTIPGQGVLEDISIKYVGIWEKGDLFACTVPVSKNQKQVQLTTVMFIKNDLWLTKEASLFEVIPFDKSVTVLNQ